MSSRVMSYAALLSEVIEGGQYLSAGATQAEAESLAKEEIDRALAAGEVVEVVGGYRVVQVV